MPNSRGRKAKAGHGSPQVSSAATSNAVEVKAQQVLWELRRQLGFQDIARLIDAIDDAAVEANGLDSILELIAETEDCDLLTNDLFLTLARVVRNVIKQIQAEAKKFYEEWHTLPTIRLFVSARSMLSIQGPAAFLDKFETLVESSSEYHRSLKDATRKAEPGSRQDGREK